MTDDICGYTTASGSPCQHFATEDDGRCWQHTDDPDTETGGRPRAFDDQQTRQRVLVAVGQGLKVGDQAALAGVSPDTLRRALCCIESPRQPTLDEDPCEFCANYARSHANGAREVLNDCRPEFVASASYGYVKEEKRTHAGDPDEPLNVTIERNHVDE
jgi:hypothetical protein